MELFHEIYGRYYRIFNALLAQACLHPLSTSDIIEQTRQTGFRETPLHLPPMITNGEYPLFEKRGAQYWGCCEPVMRPLSCLEKRWLASLLLDSRIHLFIDSSELLQLQQQLHDVKPLFYPSDFHCFDQAHDCDSMEDLAYQSHFKTIWKSILERQNLWIRFLSGKNKENEGVFFPFHIQYSQKDGKFRLLARRIHKGRARSIYTINLARIHDIKPIERNEPIFPSKPVSLRKRHHIQVAVSNERQCLERCFLHFSHYQCAATADDEKNVYLTIRYDPSDETELLIRILSFGPMIHVIAPNSFIQQIQSRLQKQKELFAQNLAQNQP